MRTSLSASIADWATIALHDLTQVSGWEPHFRPLMGQFACQYRYFFEVGDLTYRRFATTAHPRARGREHFFPWEKIGAAQRRAKCKMSLGDEFLMPLVVVRVDLTVISQRLAEAFSLSPAGKVRRLDR